MYACIANDVEVKAKRSWFCKASTVSDVINIRSL